MSCHVMLCHVVVSVLVCDACLVRPITIKRINALSPNSQQMCIMVEEITLFNTNDLELNLQGHLLLLLNIEGLGVHCALCTALVNPCGLYYLGLKLKVKAE